MRIAFDVKGTLQGHDGERVLALLLKLQELGHECLVWSNSYGYAVDCVKKLGLKCEYQSKTDKSDADHDETRYVDLAIDDDSTQTWLASKRFIWVRDLPKDIEGILKLAHEIDSSK
jgi:hypothetical protein